MAIRYSAPIKDFWSKQFLNARKTTNRTYYYYVIHAAIVRRADMTTLYCIPNNNNCTLLARSKNVCLLSKLEHHNSMILPVKSVILRYRCRFNMTIELLIVNEFAYIKTYVLLPLNGT